ncbi:hypothetical protein B0H19DRAFT_1073407 [Mycena capillaripes]|nr:hypothetical protein B0H19DRAFT_1073407 [Mycena capillaripes]
MCSIFYQQRKEKETIRRIQLWLGPDLNRLLLLEFVSESLHGKQGWNVHHRVVLSLYLNITISTSIEEKQEDLFQQERKIIALGGGLENPKALTKPKPLTQGRSQGLAPSSGCEFSPASTCASMSARVSKSTWTFFGVPAVESAQNGFSTMVGDRQRWKLEKTDSDRIYKWLNMIAQGLAKGGSPGQKNPRP